MNVAAHTFERAARIAASRQIQNISMAGHHMALAHQHGPFVANIHRCLADERGAEAAFYGRLQEGYESAWDAVVQREVDARNEARELELARAFNDTLDARGAAPVAA